MPLVSNLLDARKQRRYLKMLMYGAPGVGKTTLLHTATLDERINKILWIAFDDNCATIVTSPNVDLVAFSINKGEMIEQVDQFIGQLADLNRNGWVEPDNYDMVVVDSLSTFYDKYLGSKAEATKGANSSEAMNQIQHYGHTRNAITAFISQLMVAPLHFAMTAHVDLTHTERGKQILMPLTPGTYGANIVGKFSQAAYVSRNGNKVTVEFHRDNAHTAARGVGIVYTVSDPNKPFVSALLDALENKA